MLKKIKYLPRKVAEPLLQWFSQHLLTIVCCVLIVGLGVVFLVWSSPGTTTIGENISTGNITASGNLEVGGNATTSGDFTVSGDLKAKTGRTATIVVAAYNSSTSSKAQADYICDGVDDQVEIQAAIDALPSGGGKIKLTEGIFNLSGAITLSSNIWLQGFGMYSTKLFVGNEITENAIEAINKEGIIISDLEIDGNKDNNTKGSGDRKQNGIYWEKVTNSIIERVYSHDNIFHGIFLFNGSSYNKILNCVLKGNQYRGAHAHTNCSYNLWQGNLLIENGESGFGGLFVIYNGNNYNIVKANTIISDYHIGMQISGGDPNGGNLPCEGNIVVDNVIDVSSNPSVHGIEITYADTLSNIVIANNKIKASRHGIVCSAGAPTDILIKGNNILSVAKGIYFLHGGSSIQIIGNRIYGQGEEPIYLSGVTDSICSNNRVKSHSTYDAITLKNVQRTIVSGNYISDAKYAIDETGDCNNNIIRNNIGHSIYTSPYFNLQDDDLSRANEYHVDCFQNLQAASTTYIHAAITGTGAEQEVTTGITSPDVPRNVSITTTNNASPSGDVTIEGIDAKGNSIVENITIVPGGTAYGDKAFAKVTKIILPAGVSTSDTVSVGISDKLGLSNVIYETGDIYKVKRNNADDTIGTVDVTNGTVDCATINAGDDITIYYRSNLNIID